MPHSQMINEPSEPARKRIKSWNSGKGLICSTLLWPTPFPTYFISCQPLRCHTWLIIYLYKYKLILLRLAYYSIFATWMFRGSWESLKTKVWPRELQIEVDKVIQILVTDNSDISSNFLRFAFSRGKSQRTAFMEGTLYIQYRDLS